MSSDLPSIVIESQDLMDSLPEQDQDRVWCPICTHFMTAPHRTQCCEKLLCEACALQLQGRACSLCADCAALQTSLSRPVQRLNLALRVRCGARVEAEHATQLVEVCDFEGTVAQLLQHRQSGACAFERADCDRCGQPVLRRDLERHLEQLCAAELACPHRTYTKCDFRAPAAQMSAHRAQHAEHLEKARDYVEHLERECAMLKAGVQASKMMLEQRHELATAELRRAKDQLARVSGAYKELLASRDALLAAVQQSRDRAQRPAQQQQQQQPQQHQQPEFPRDMNDVSALTAYLLGNR